MKKNTAPDDPSAKAEMKNTAESRNDRSKRSWLRFFRLRLWHLMLLLTLCAIFLGTAVRSAKTEYEAYLALSKIYGIRMELSDPPEYCRWLPTSLLEVYGGLLFQDVIELEDARDAPTEEDLADVFSAIGELRSLETLRFDSCFLGEEELQGFQNKGLLRELDLRYSMVSLETISHMPRFASLRELWLDDSTIDGEGLFTRTRFPALKQLSAEDSYLKDQAVLDLADLPLEDLDLSGCALSSKALGRLDQMRSLKKLRLRGIQVDAEACERIGRLPSLLTLELGSSGISDSDLRFIAKSGSELEHLDISYCENVTDASVELLLSIPNLEFLNVQGTSITATGAAILASSPTIKYFDLGEYQISWEGLEAFQGEYFGHWSQDDILARLIRFPEQYDQPREVQIFTIDTQLKLDRDRLAAMQDAEIDRLFFKGEIPDQAILEAFYDRYAPHSIEASECDFSVENLPDNQDLYGIDLTDTKVGDALFERLNEYPNLGSLVLRGENEIVGSGFSDWKLPPELWKLRLEGFVIDSMDIERIANLQNLEDLSFEAEPDVAGLLKLLQNQPCPNLNWKLPGPHSDYFFYWRNDSSWFGNATLDAALNLEQVSSSELAKIAMTLPFSKAGSIILTHCSEEHLQAHIWLGELTLLEPQESALTAKSAAALQSVDELRLVQHERPLRELVEFAKELKCRLSLGGIVSSKEDLTALQELSRLDNLEYLGVTVEDLQMLYTVLDLELGTPENIEIKCKEIGEYTGNHVTALRSMRSSEPLDRMIRSIHLISGIVSDEKIESIADVYFPETLVWRGKEGEVPPAELQDASKGQIFEFSNCHITSEFLEGIARFPWLRILTFWNCTFEEGSFGCMEESKSARDITFYRCKLDDAVLDSLGARSGEQLLYFGACELSEKSWERLQSLGPNVTVRSHD
ncbi:MAG: hypothetical protein AAF483_13460 [Planctomycetota bacterium]